MKIVDVSAFYSEQGGGVRTYVHQKLAAAARLGHVAVIIAPGRESREDIHPGGKIVWVKAPVLPVDKRYHMFLSSTEVMRILNREQPDVVEGSTPWYAGWIAGHWQGSAVKSLVMHADPVAVYAHTLLGARLGIARVDRLFGWFWRYLRRLNAPFDCTVVAGEWLARRFTGFGLRNVVTVPFGIDRAHFHGGMRDPALRARMLAACGLPETAKLLLTIGRHHPEKRLPVMISAVGKVNQARPDGVGLYLVGDGLSRARIDRAAAQVPHVHVAGQVPDRALVARMMASADAVIHGSGCETFGLSVAEALCCGAPIIVPDTGGAFDFAGPEYSEVYPLGDADGAAKAIGRLLARDWNQLAKAANAAAASRIGTADTHFDRLFALYESLVRQRSQPRT
ncbi:MAG: glycosyltransferase [Rhodospirillaceae bacterium]|nr:glycosyltransferase [Rhodospirillaceae bacterium]